MKRSRYHFLRVPLLAITKRQRFILCVAILSMGLFISEQLLGKSGFITAIILSLLASFFFVLIEFRDIKENYSLYIFVLPLFFYTLAIGMFYFLIPSRILTRLMITSLYAVGIYSLYLSQNIFVIASLRTIPLLSGARIVSFITTFVSYLLVSIVVFSLHLSLSLTALLMFIFSFLAVFQSIAVSYDKLLETIKTWVMPLSLCLLEISIILWFWPASPTVIAIFISVFFNAIIGLSRVWIEKRLFKSALWEYVWLAVMVFFVLMTFSTWRG